MKRLLMAAGLMACATMANAEYIQGGSDRTRLWLCDTPEQTLKIMESARDDGYQASIGTTRAINAIPNEYGEPACGYVTATFTYLKQFTVAENIPLSDGQRHTLYLIVVSYVDTAGRERTAAFPHKNPLPVSGEPNPASMSDI